MKNYITNKASESENNKYVKNFGYISFFKPQPLVATCV